jgi:hypothetical protein
MTSQRRRTLYERFFSQPERSAPVQTAGLRSVPWEVSAEAWKEYAAQGHGDQSHERLCERGGFGAAELAILLYDRIKRLEEERVTAPARERSRHHGGGNVDTAIARVKELESTLSAADIRAGLLSAHGRLQWLCKMSQEAAHQAERRLSEPEIAAALGLTALENVMDIIMPEWRI